MMGKHKKEQRKIAIIKGKSKFFLPVLKPLLLLSELLEGGEINGKRAQLVSSLFYMPDLYFLAHLPLFSRDEKVTFLYFRIKAFVYRHHPGALFIKEQLLHIWAPLLYLLSCRKGRFYLLKDLYSRLEDFFERKIAPELDFYSRATSELLYKLEEIKKAAQLVDDEKIYAPAFRGWEEQVIFIEETLKNL